MRHWIVPLLIAATPATALELTLRESFPLQNPASLEYDPDLCALWIVNESKDVVLFSLFGKEMRRFETDMYQVKALTVQGDNLILSNGFGRFQLSDKEGNLLGAPYTLRGDIYDIEGIVAEPGGALIITEDDSARVWSINPDGSENWRIEGFKMEPRMVEPQGIARDRLTGNLLVVDDREGSNSVFEFAPDGTFLDQVSLLEYGIDPEGVAVQSNTGTLFIGFDSGSRLAIFDYLPTKISGYDGPEQFDNCITS